ncbi:MAG TPA: PDZ domain-containing protein [Candidatus Eisenbacteria bacterium]|nr:PDZ domain-containing protein [Candidatus Eisenbacteria bacterium]
MLVFVIAASSIAAVDPRYVTPLDGTLPKPSAPVVYSVTRDTPAARAGLVVGDTIWSIDGSPVATLSDLKHILLRRRGIGPARFVVGTRSGRKTVDITPVGDPPKVGVLVTDVQVRPEAVQLDDPHGAVLVSVTEWAGYTLVQVMAKNRGKRPMPFGAKYVELIDGRGAAIKTVTAESMIARVYESDPDTAQSSAVERRNRANDIRDIRMSTMKDTVILPGGDASGFLNVARTGVAQPLTVRVTLSGRVYTARFGKARG